MNGQDQGITRIGRGEWQPSDKERAQEAHQTEQDTYHTCLRR
jgi:hypothetical protein